jgi:hypothetical protein
MLKAAAKEALVTKPRACILFLAAALASGAAFGGLPEKKQKNPGRADCVAPAPGSGAPTGIAITEGGPDQHADRPKPKGRIAAPGTGAGTEAEADGATAAARSGPAGPIRWTAPEADPRARPCP